MAVLNFPSSPAVNDLYIGPNGITYQWTGEYWAVVTVRGVVMVSSTPPNNPRIGDLWWNSASGKEYVWYYDGNTSQWVITQPSVNTGSGGGGGGVPSGPAGGDLTGDYPNPTLKPNLILSAPIVTGGMVIAGTVQVAGNITQTGNQTVSGTLGVTGILTAPTAVGGTNTTQVATTAFVQNAVGSITGGLTYRGTWNANTNTPTLTSSVGTTGDYYFVSVTGTTNLNGTISWAVGDQPIFNGTIWQKQPGGLTSGQILTALGYTPANQAGDNFTGPVRIGVTPPGTHTFEVVGSGYISGIFEVPTATIGTASSQVASTKFVQDAVEGISIPAVTSIALGSGLEGTSNPLTSTGEIDLSDTTVSPGTYGSGTLVPVLTVDQKGRVTNVSSTPVVTGGGAAVTSVSAGVGISVPSNTGAVSVSLATLNSGGTAGDATHIPVITWDTRGRVTGVVTVPVGVTGAVTSVNAGSGVTASPTTGAVVVSMADIGGGGSAGSSSTIPVLTWDSKGRVTSGSSVALSGTFSGNVTATGTIGVAGGTHLQTSGQFSLWNASGGASIYYDSAAGTYYHNPGGVNGVLTVSSSVFRTTATPQWASGGPWAAASSRELKTGIEPVETSAATQRIMGMLPVEFDWAAGNAMERVGHERGFVAEDVEAIYPELVHSFDQPHGDKAAPQIAHLKAYSLGNSFSADLVAVVQDLYARVQVLEGQANG